MPLRLIPNSTVFKEIAGVRFELVPPSNGQSFRIAQHLMAIKDQSLTADIDALMRVISTLVKSIDGQKANIADQLVNWADFKGQLALVATISELGSITDDDEKNSGSSSDGRPSEAPARPNLSTVNDAGHPDAVSSSTT